MSGVNEKLARTLDRLRKRFDDDLSIEEEDALRAGVTALRQRPDDAVVEALRMIANGTEDRMKLRLNTLGMSHESARKVAARKTVWMVLWLRERRDPTGLRAFYRRKHFQERRHG